MRLPNIKKTCFLTLLIAGILSLGLLLHASMRDTFEFNPDEGTNLIKARLVGEGFNLYKQIWSDQPPLFTALLSSWFRLFGASVYSGRFLTLFFSLILFWGFYQNIRIRTDALTALTAGIFLILSSQFLILSISVMIGIPSLALAMLSLYCATTYSRSGHKTKLFLSAVFMAFSLLTKFFTVFILPLILLEIISHSKKNKKTPDRALIPAGSWLSSVILIYSLVILAYFYPELKLFTGQLFKPHMARIDIPGADFSVIFRAMIQDYDLTLLAIFGLVLNFRIRKTPHILLPALWLGIALLFLTLYRPVWDHYYLLISIPICWLAAIFFVRAFRETKAKKNKTFSYYSMFALMILAATMLPLKLIDACFLLKRSGQGEENKILDLIARFKTTDRWIFTDLPIYAFKSGILVPPETAVLTLKRFPEAKTVEPALKKYKPGLILLGNFTDYDREMLSRIQKDYRKEMEISIRRPITNTVCLWQPISTFLPPRMQLSAGKRFNDSKQNFKIPIIKRASYFYSQKTILYVLKTDAG